MWKGRIAARVSLVVALSAAAAAQTDSWLQIRTAHFQIVSNAGEKEARRSAHQLEAMRSVFQQVFPEAELDTATPILVLAVQNRAAMEALEPAEYMGDDRLRLMGLFMSSQERSYILLQLNAPGSHPYAAVYHEYAHFVFSRMRQWMPVWFSEGIAEFYQNTEILENKVRLGRGDPGLQSVLEHNALLPLDTLFSVDQHSSYYHERDKGSVFYGESWALTHYLKDKDDRDGTHKLADYLDLLQSKSDPVAAAVDTFGDLTQLQQDLRKYILRSEYATTEIPASSDIDESSFLVQALPVMQVDTMRAEFLAHVGRLTDARSLLLNILREDPANAPAREVMAYAAFREQKFDEAQKWCEEAIKLDSTSFFAHYMYAAVMIHKGMPDKATLESVESSLRAAIKLNPTFAPDYDALAMFYAIRGVNLTEAHDLIEQAVQLAPGIPEIHIDESEVLANMGRTHEAMEAIDLALKMSHTPEQTAAVENFRESLRKVIAEQAKGRNQKVTMTAEDPRGVPAGTTPPRAIYAPQAEYTEEARRANLQGNVEVSLTVGAGGKPSDVVVTRKLGMGLDEKAVAAVKQWKFEPERRNGRAVVSRLHLQLGFKLFGTDTQKFFDLSQKASTGDPAAEFELANVYFEGKDVPKDETQGMALLERAARRGWPKAQFLMGDRTYGDGTNADKYVGAYVWYALARRSGADGADAKVTEVESRMTPDQLTEARKQLAEWKGN